MDRVDFTLNLYSDSGYSTLLGTMGQASEPMDWIVYRSSSSGNVYPNVYQGGSMGTAWLEAESGAYISLISPYTETLSESNAAALFTLSVTAGNNYTIDLDVPAGADFDLYLFILAAGASASGLEFNSSSSSSTLGQDESISVNATNNGVYGIVAVRRTGAGVAAVTVNIQGDSGPIPGFEFLYATMSFSLAILLTIQLLKKRNQNVI